MTAGLVCPATMIVGHETVAGVLLPPAVLVLTTTMTAGLITPVVSMTATRHLLLVVTTLVAPTMAGAVASNVRASGSPMTSEENLPIAVAAIEAMTAMTVTATAEAAAELGAAAWALSSSFPWPVHFKCQGA